MTDKFCYLKSGVPTPGSRRSTARLGRENGWKKRTPDRQTPDCAHLDD